MRTRYSKPISDVGQESADWVFRDGSILAEQRELVRTMPVMGVRQLCLLCEGQLAGAFEFDHRSTCYIGCPRCGHIQARDSILETPGLDFEDVYPKVDEAAWKSRRDRIYGPKLEWILEALAELGTGREVALRLPWLEIGSGAGYFLGALVNSGASHIRGVDANEVLCQRSRQALGVDLVECTSDLAKVVRRSDACVYASFFVLEHLSKPGSLLDALAAKPSGTVFAFAVPTFGFAALLEAIHGEHAARSLDNIVHRQLYTDSSISYLLQRIGYEPVSRWVFGQDAVDVRRAALVGLRAVSRGPVPESWLKAIDALVDPMQQAVDRAMFADARHIVAVKR